jgi:phosphonate transport system permease protein
MALAALWAAHGLGLGPAELLPRGGGLTILSDFTGAAFSPAFAYEAPVPTGTVALPWKVLDSLRRTLLFAAAGMSLALVIGLPLGLLASTVWWRGRALADTPRKRWFLRSASSGVFVLLRALIAFMRSVHELLWAVLLLAALGLHPFSAVCAIAIPYAGTLAKVFSEILDEAPAESAEALRGSGAGPVQVFLFGLLPRALPDMAAYAFYRFECALRSSAVLGFFGFPTLGYFVKIAFNNQRYHEVWSYLWALIVVVLVLEYVSGALRRRVVVR